jgi:hypothetical protein
MLLTWLFLGSGDVPEAFPSSSDWRIVAWLPKLLAPAKRYPTDISFFEAMSLDLSTSLMISRMQTHAYRSDWFHKPVGWARARTGLAKAAF